MVWSEAEEIHRGRIGQGFAGSVEGLGLDIVILTVLVVTVTVVTMMFQMKKIRLRVIHSLGHQVFIEHLLCRVLGK